MTGKPILNFVIEPADLQRLEAFRHKFHFPTRAAATKWLITFALKQHPKPTAAEVQEFSEWRGRGSKE